MNARLAYCISLFWLCSIFSAWAQLQPPGMNDANAGAWLALVLRQDIGKKGNLVTYAGQGWQGNPANWALFQHKAMFIANTEYYYQLNKKWRASFALSYRIQYEYEKEPPYQPAAMPFRREFRLYGRVIRTFEVGRWQFNFFFRQEYRKFFRPDWEQVNTDLLLRTRLRAQAVYQLNPAKTKRVVVGAEALFNTIKSKGDWQVLDYRETRAVAFYSHQFAKAPKFTLNIGLMTQLNGKPADDIEGRFYLTADLTISNLFGRKKK